MEYLACCLQIRLSEASAWFRRALALALSKGWRPLRRVVCLMPLLLLCLSCSNTPSVPILSSEVLQPNDTFLTPPRIFDPRREYGYLGTVNVIVPATANIYLAEAEEGTIIENPEQDTYDSVPGNSPVSVLDDLLEGGETIDIYASGEAKHVPLPSISFGPEGISRTKVTVGPALGIESVSGPLGSLVGLFDNQPKPFIIGQRRQIMVPRGAQRLYLGFLDYPGSSSDNQGNYSVSIEILRR